MNHGELLGLILACAPSVAPGTIQSVIDVESGGSPIAIGVNRGGRLPRNATDIVDAIAIARRLQAAGANFDAGLMQINSTNWPRLGLTAETVFEPCTNIRAGARILTENYTRATRQYGSGRPALLAALSAYNTGSMQRGFHNGYVAKVNHAAAKRSGAPLPPPVMPSMGRAAFDWSPGHAAAGAAAGVSPDADWSAPAVWGGDIAPERLAQPDRALLASANKDAY